MTSLRHRNREAIAGLFADFADKRGLHPNSRAANRTVDHAGREAEVLAVLDRHGTPMTDRAICEALGSADMNYARPAVTKLVQAGVLVEVDSVECPTTGRTVRRVGRSHENGKEAE